MPNERHYNELNLESVGINLPYNMQAEQSVLGAVLLKPETLTDLVEIIRPEMFYTRQNAQIYSEMLRLFTSDQTIDFVTLLDAVISDGVFPSADEAKVYLTGPGRDGAQHLQRQGLRPDRAGKVSGAPADGCGKGHFAGRGRRAGRRPAAGKRRAAHL